MIHKKIVLNDTATLDLYILDSEMEKPFVLIMPGGGYVFTSDREAEPIAMAFNGKGINAGVLRYTTLDKVTKVYKHATLEAAMALDYIEQYRERWNITKVGVCGFSAGGNLALQIATHSKDAWLSDYEFNIDFLIASYPMISTEIFDLLEPIAYEYVKNPMSVKMRILGTDDPSDQDYYEYNVLNYIDAHTVPMFIWHTYEDELVMVADALNLASTLNKHRVPFELHVFEKGPHGLALANRVSAVREDQVDVAAEKWFDMCITWIGRL